MSDALDQEYSELENYRKSIVEQRQKLREKRGFRKTCSLNDAVRSFIKKSGLKFFSNNAPLVQAWNDTVGEEIAGLTKVISLRGGVLKIEVYNSPLLQELSGFYKQSLLESIRAVFEDKPIKDIKFSLGTEKEDKREN